jgi:hypothetical protein
MKLHKETYNLLIDEIGKILSEGRKKAAHSINTVLVQTYWTIGRHIVKFEQKGKE